jgi:hypothetical protein
VVDNKRMISTCHARIPPVAQIALHRMVECLLKSELEAQGRERTSSNCRWVNCDDTCLKGLKRTIKTGQDIWFQGHNLDPVPPK